MATSLQNYQCSGDELSQLHKVDPSDVHQERKDL